MKNRFDREFPDNLYYDLFGYVKLPDDYEDSVRYVIETLKERDRRAIELRYMKRETLEVVGRDLGVCREGARVIINAVLSKIKQSSRWNCLRYGLKGYKEMKEKREEERELKRLANLKRIEKIINERGEFISIDDMGMGTRASNCLKRKGIFTSGDLDNISLNELKSIKSLGKKSLAEILSLCELYGISKA